MFLKTILWARVLQILWHNWPSKLPNAVEWCKIMPLFRSRSFKVTSFGTNWKPICDFLLVINTNLHPISHHFQVVADYWSNLHFWQGEYSFGVNPRSQDHGIWPQETTNITLSYSVVIYWQIIILFCYNAHIWQMVRQTEFQQQDCVLHFMMAKMSIWTTVHFSAFLHYISWFIHGGRPN